MNLSISDLRNQIFLSTLKNGIKAEFCASFIHLLETSRYCCNSAFEIQIFSMGITFASNFLMVYVVFGNRVAIC